MNFSCLVKWNQCLRLRNHTSALYFSINLCHLTKKGAPGASVFLPLSLVRLSLIQENELFFSFFLVLFFQTNLKLYPWSSVFCTWVMVQALYSHEHNKIGGIGLRDWATFVLPEQL